MNDNFATKGGAAAPQPYANAATSAAFALMTMLFERFAYYGARALIILFLIEELGFTTNHSYHIYALLGTAAFMAPMLCGWLCDQFLDKRLSMIGGNVLSGVGMLLVATGNEVLLLIGLGIWSLGSGAVRPALLTYYGEMVQGYGRGRLDGFYTVLYLVINLGAFLAPLAFGAYGANNSYGGAFLLVGLTFFLNAGLGLAGMLTGMMEQEYETDLHTDEPVTERTDVKWMGILGVVGMIFLLVPLMLTGMVDLFGEGVSILSNVLMGTIFVGLVVLAMLLSPKKILGTLTVVLAIFLASIFWMAFEATGSNFYILGQKMAEELGMKASSFMALNPLLTVVFGVLIGGLTLAVVPRKYGLWSGLKITMGFLIGILGFFSLSGATGSGSIMFPVLMGTVLLAFAEILTGPVIISIIFTYAPRRSRATLMGAYIGASSLFAVWLGRLFFEPVYNEELPTEGILHGALIMAVGLFVSIAVLVLLNLVQQSDKTPD